MNSSESNLKSGMWVKTTGFIMNPEWNGMSGVLRELLQDKGLWVVNFPALAESGEHATFCVGPTYLKPLEEQSLRNYPLASNSWAMVRKTGNCDWDGIAGIVERDIPGEDAWVVQLQDGSKDRFKVQAHLLIPVVPASRRIHRKAVRPTERVALSWMAMGISFDDVVSTASSEGNNGHAFFQWIVD